MQSYYVAVKLRAKLLATAPLVFQFSLQQTTRACNDPLCSIFSLNSPPMKHNRIVDHNNNL